MSSKTSLTNNTTIHNETERDFGVNSEEEEYISPWTGKQGS